MSLPMIRRRRSICCRSLPPSNQERERARASKCTSRSWTRDPTPKWTTTTWQNWQHSRRSLSKNRRSLMKLKKRWSISSMTTRCRRSGTRNWWTGTSTRYRRTSSTTRAKWRSKSWNQMFRNTSSCRMPLAKWPRAADSNTPRLLATKSIRVSRRCTSRRHRSTTSRNGGASRSWAMLAWTPGHPMTTCPNSNTAPARTWMPCRYITRMPSKSRATTLA